ncbi:MAG: hypothetical protein LBL84_02330 [Candidatus Nomurabacteria bacterium]|jgi:hypothetical protein|nr:hypothetical protein [Candidatus Nomurabacteria bacterium]
MEVSTLVEGIVLFVVVVAAVIWSCYSGRKHSLAPLFTWHDVRLLILVGSVLVLAPLARYLAELAWSEEAGSFASCSVLAVVAVFLIVREIIDRNKRKKGQEPKPPADS